MSEIRVLPDQVANQIAAGEVIERPASVVKELVENSIDAGATRIEVEFRRGGTSFMRVEDNGRGMVRDDALLALERHATSKIRKAKDLDKLTTMGFRGEALPSIASVSRFQLQTRRGEEESGTEVVVDGGRILHVRDCGMPSGTRMTVSKLFNTVPARRKFLKSITTESAHIVHSVRLYALAHPEIGFTLVDDGRILFQSPACERLQDRISEIFGRQIATKLIEVDVEEDGMRLRGLIGKPTLSRASRHEMLFFVNHRPVENKTLSYAVVESYYGHIPKGRYPVAFLFLNIAPERVDVNIHPAKREIRFREETKARGFAVRTLLNALRGESEASPVIKPVPLKPPLSSSQVRDEQTRVKPQPQSSRPRLVRHDPETAGPVYSSAAASSSAPEGQHEAPAAKRTPRAQQASASPAATPPERTHPAPQPAKLGENWTYKGWAQGEFALFDTPSGIVLLNVKAAQQRIWYERLLVEFSGSKATQSQRMLLPQPVEFDPVSSALVEEHLGFFSRLGFDVAPFGRNFYRIEGTPTWLDEGKAEEFLKDIVALLRQGALSADKEDMAVELIAKRAALRVARLKEKPREEEIEPLLKQLFACEKPLTDPEGRPSLVELSVGELNRRFQRRDPSRQADLF